MLISVDFDEDGNAVRAKVRKKTIARRPFFITRDGDNILCYSDVTVVDEFYTTNLTLIDEMLGERNARL